jgi:hypothetical protein
MVSYSASTRASFIAQGIATDVTHLEWLIEEGIQHNGFSFITVLTPCVTYNPPWLFEVIKEKAFYLRDAEPVSLPESSVERPWLHDPSDISLAFKLARVPLLEQPLLGVFFRGRPEPADQIEDME